MPNGDSSRPPVRDKDGNIVIDARSPIVPRDAHGQWVRGAVPNPTGIRHSGMSKQSFLAAVALESAVPEAADVLIYGLRSDNEWIRIRAATTILEHQSRLDEARALAEKTDPHQPTELAWMTAAEEARVFSILAKASARKKRGEPPKRDLDARPLEPVTQLAPTSHNSSPYASPSANDRDELVIDIPTHEPEP